MCLLIKQDSLIGSMEWDSRICCFSLSKFRIINNILPFLALFARKAVSPKKDCLFCCLDEAQGTDKQTFILIRKRSLTTRHTSLLRRRRRTLAHCIVNTLTRVFWVILLVLQPLRKICSQRRKEERCKCHSNRTNSYTFEYFIFSPSFFFYLISMQF